MCLNYFLTKNESLCCILLIRYTINTPPSQQKTKKIKKEKKNILSCGSPFFLTPFFLTPLLIRQHCLSYYLVDALPLKV